MSKKLWLLVGSIIVLAILTMGSLSPIHMPYFPNLFSTDRAVIDVGYQGGGVYSGTDGYAEHDLSTTVFPEPQQYYPPYYPQYDDGLSVDQRQYQVDANFGVVVPDVSTYLQSLRESFLLIDGRVLEMSSNSYDGMQSGNIIAKIPVASFDQAISTTTQGVIKVANQSMSTSDVTGVKVGLESQITTLEDQRALREIDLLEAKTDADKRRIQMDITRLQSQIDSLKIKLENQQEQVQYGTLSVMAASSERYFDSSIPPTLKETWDTAVASLLKSVMVVLQFAIWVLVYAVVLVPLVWAVGKLRHRKATQIEPNDAG